MAMKLRAATIATALALSLFSTACFAQAYPTKPIKLIIPYNPGGIVDFVARTLARNLSEELNQTIVAENRPGAGGIVGTDAVARSEPDGYTMLLMDPAIVINPTLLASVPYDLFKQLEAVSVVSSSPLVLVVAPQLGVKSFAEFVAYGKANPGKMNFASAGVGTTPHLAGELFKLSTGIDAIHVPYKGISQSYTDLMSDKIQFAFSSITGALPFTSDSRVLPLATTGAKRNEVFPDKPTVLESGLKDFQVDLWLTVFLPAGTPPAIKAKLNTAINTSLAKADLKAAFAKVGVEPRGTSAADAATFVKDDYARWKKVIVDAKITLN